MTSIKIEKTVDIVGEYDVVVAGGQLADELQIRAGVHDFAGDDALVGEDSLGVADALDNLIGGGAVVNGQLALCGDAVPAQIAGIDGISVQNDNFHVQAPLCFVC
mgnify:CR=1 FL=1